MLVLVEMLDGTDRFRVVFKVWHHELLREAGRGDLFGERRVEDAQPVGFRLFMEWLAGLLNLLPDDILYVLCSGNLRDLPRL